MLFKSYNKYIHLDSIHWKIKSWQTTAHKKVDWKRAYFSTNF
jgi:hypothetical protein